MMKRAKYKQKPRPALVRINRPRTPKPAPERIGPQPGPQYDFVSCDAGLAIYGGSAGGGKSFALLLDAANLCQRWPDYGAVIFRRTSKQVTAEGGLWDQSERVFQPLGANGAKHNLSWRFPNGSTVTFAHLEHDKDRFSWQGAQIAYIAFDELTHFSEAQFWYLLSRNRSGNGGPTLLRATCNPDPDHFIARMIDWYIDDETGYANRTRSGVTRFFVRDGDAIRWGASAAALKQAFPMASPRTFTFVAATVEDNAILCKTNPDYIANLMSLPTVEREQLRYGNWRIRPDAGSRFRRSWFKVIEAEPTDFVRVVRYWDRAASEPSPSNPTPDWTVGLKMGLRKNGRYVVLDVVREQLKPFGVEALMKQTAELDGVAVEIVLEQDPGSAGVAEVAYYIRALAGFDVRALPKRRDKLVASGPVSAQAEAGNIDLLDGGWVFDFLSELVSFPKGRNDDQVDTLSGAFTVLAGAPEPIEPGDIVTSANVAGLQRPVFTPRTYR